MNYSDIEAAINALNEFDGNKTKAAESLGISRRTLGRRISEGYHQGFLANEADLHKFPAHDVSCYWVKTENGSFLVKKPEINMPSYEELREKFFEDVANHTFEYKELVEPNGDNLLVIDPADIHFGKLAMVDETGTKYDLEIAHERLITGIKKLLNKASMFGLHTIVFVLGNDWLHIDNHIGTTTSGTRQDCDGPWYAHFDAAKKAFVEAIEYCREFANVKLIYNPSNHDWKTGKHLADYITAWFRNDPHVDVTDASMSLSHRKYLVFGSNLLGFTHGDGAKELNLPSLMQYEARAAWSKTRYATWLLHHIHHKKTRNFGKNKRSVDAEKDHIGVTIIQESSYVAEDSVKLEYVRSPSESDGWHDRNGYVGNAAIECFLFHNVEGPVARFTQFF